MVFPVFPHNSQAPVYGHARRRGGATPLAHVASSRKLGDVDALAAAKRERQASREKQLASLLAGGIAGTFSATITCPIEVVKTHLQASRGGSQVALAATAGPVAVARNILRVEGMKGMFRGLVPTIVGILPARSTYFWAYSTTKASLSARLGGESAPVHMASAAAAGVLSNTLTNPIWLIKSRVQLQAGAAATDPRAYRGYADAVAKIFREEGIRGFWKGVSASYYGTIESALQFTIYEGIKARIVTSNRAKLARGEYLNDPNKSQAAGDLTPFQYLASASLAKFIASTATYPHEVVRTRMREQPRFLGAVPQYRGMLQSLKLIAKEEGRRGLYAGMGTHLARVVPNAAIMFFTYETVVKAIERRQRDREASRVAGVSQKKKRY